MAYLIPTLYVIVSYTFFLLPGLFDHVMELKILSILLPFIMGVVNLITVLTVGRKWTRKTLLNCTLIIKYGLIPFYLIGGSITIGVTVAALFPLPLMALLGLVTIVFLIFGYGILLGASPYALAYIIKSCKEGKHSKIVAILSGICQFLFTVSNPRHYHMSTIKEKHLVKTTICVFGGMCLIILLILLDVFASFV